MSSATSKRSRSGLAAALVLSSALAGCTVGPDFKKPQAPVAPSWREGKNARVATQTPTDSRWWKAFNDPALDRLIDLAYRQNLPLQIAGLRIAESRARLAIATGQQFPQSQVVYGRGGAVGVTKQKALAFNVDRNFFDYELGFDATWELDLWGKYRRGVEAEAAGLLASVADYRDVLVSLTAEVARTYAVIRTFQVLVEQAQQNVTLQEEGLRIADAHFRNGATSELDVAQATALLESTRATIPDLRRDLEQAQNALGTLLGQPVATFDPLLAGPKEIPKAPEQVAVTVPAELLRRRPDIRSAELNAAAQCARIGIAKSELYPSFSIFGEVGLQANSVGPGSHNLFSGDALFYSVGPRIVWPFFNYGRLKNGVRVEDARFQQLLVQYQNTVLQAAQEVEDSLVGFVNSREALLSREAAVKAAQRAEELALIQYREGAEDYQRVLDAQRSLLQEQNNLAEVRSSVATSWIAVYKALGGGWEFSRGKAFVPEPMQREMKERTDWGDMLSEPRGPEKDASPPQGEK